MKSLEKIDIAGLFKMLNKSSSEESIKIIEEVKSLIAMMQGYRLIKELEDFKEKYPEVKKVCIVCVQTQYNDEGMYDGVYFDSEVRLVEEKTKKKYVNKIMPSFDAEDYEAIQTYADKNEKLVEYGWGNQRQGQVDQMTFEEKGDWHVAKINSMLEEMFERVCTDWMVNPLTHRLVGEVIDMKDPMALLDKMYDPKIVNYVKVQMQKEELESALKDEKREQKEEIRKSKSRSRL